ncbi:hypothetical protein LDENG_00102000, partial [Lucifuga dentata]
PTFLDPCFQTKSFCSITFSLFDNDTKNRTPVWNDYYFIVNILRRFSIYLYMVTAEMQEIGHHPFLNMFLTVLKTIC